MKINTSVFGKILLVTTLLVSVFVAKSAYAMTPTVSASYSGSGDSVQINISGDANSGAALYFSGSSGLQVQALGSTNSSGALSTTISSGQYGILSGSSVYVVVNGQQSPSANWPSYSNTSSTGGTLSLSQTGVVLSVGQTSSITANNNTGSSLYVSNNSNPVVANINLSGNQITVTANNQGSTVFTVCSIVNTTNCSSVYVTVQNSGTQALSFSQSNVTVAPGQNVSVNITGGTGSYTVLSNSNPSIIQTSISGSILNISTNSTSGSATLTVCSSDQTGCGIINVTAGTVSSTGVTFSQSNPSIAIGQTSSITIYGGSSYTVSSNSNSAVVQSTIVNNTLTLFGISSGTATITVCQSSGSCGTITATVTGAGSGGTIALSQNSINLLTGQTLTVTISGGSVPYNLPSYSSSIFQASLSGNVITITGVSSGSSLLTVCSASGGCTTLSITVNASNGTNTGSLVLGQSSVSINSGQSTSVYVTGNGGYYLSSNSNPNSASVSINANMIMISGVASGISNAVICQTGGQCSTLYITVNGSGSSTTTGGVLTVSQAISVGQSVQLLLSGGTGAYYMSSNSGNIFSATISGSLLTLTGKNSGSDSTSVCSAGSTCVPILVTVNPSIAIAPVVSSGGGAAFIFLKPLILGMTSGDVTELQKRLTALGLYTGPITGYYGNLTVAAVKAFQSQNGLTPLGNVGPSTRELLNK